MKIGFQSCGADQCVYVQHNRDNMVYVCLYVDCMIIAANVSEEIALVKNAIKGSFKIKELGTTKFILGMEVKNDSKARILTIKKTRYIDDVVQQFNHHDAKEVVNSCEAGLSLPRSSHRPQVMISRTCIQGRIGR